MSGEAWGGAMSGTGSGAAIGSMFGPGYGTAIGAGVGALGGFLMGSSKAKARKKKAQAQANLSAAASELSPWLTSNAQQSGQQPMANLGEQAKAADAPFVGAHSLAKSYSDIQNMENRKNMMATMSSWGNQPNANDTWAMNNTMQVPLSYQE